MKKAYRTGSLPLTTGRDEVRSNYDPEQQVVLECLTKPLSELDLNRSPPPKHTFAVFGPGKEEQWQEQRQGHLLPKTTVRELEQVVLQQGSELLQHRRQMLEQGSELLQQRRQIANLEEQVKHLEEQNRGFSTMIERLNFELYGPLFTTREQAASSILKLVCSDLDFYTAEVLKMEAKVKGQKLRTAFYAEFAECKGKDGRWKYKRLLRKCENSNKPIYEEILRRTEEMYLLEQAAELPRESLRRGMKKFFAIKNQRDLGAHAFDFQGDDGLDNETKVAIVDDIQRAINRKWWRTKPFTDSHLLQLLEHACCVQKGKLEHSEAASD